MRDMFCKGMSGALPCAPTVRQFFSGLFVLLCGMLLSPALAQDATYLSLQTDTTTLQTGQYYDIRIQVDGAVDLWLANAQIDYDPSVLYVIGTKSGSPVTKGAFFSPADSIIVQNQIKGSQIIYTASQLAPAEPVSGSGVVGSFRVYPLKAGNAVMSFRRGELIAVTFSGEGANRTAENRKLPFSPVRLELTITGDTVEPPSEATATPAPTATTFVPVFTLPAGQPTLENLAALPTVAATTAAPATETPAAAGSDASGLIPLAGGLILAAVLGLAALLVFGRRKK